MHQPGRAQKRGGTASAGTLGAGTRGGSIKYCDTPTGGQLLATNNLGAMYSVSPTGGPTSALGGVTAPTTDTPKFRTGGGKTLAVFANSDGATGPTKYDFTVAPALLGGTPPGGKYAELYKSRLALAGSSANPNRIYFSPTPDIESTWDTTNAWIDCDYSITGLAALQNALLVFSAGHTERVIGTTPPPNTDMDRSVIGAVGCFGPKALTVYNDSCYFANEKGIYQTNGVGFENLTLKGGIDSYWRSIPFTGTFARAAALTVYRDFLIVNLYTTSSNTFFDCLVCYLPKLAWSRMTNLNAVMWDSSRGLDSDLYYVDRGSLRVVRCDSMFSPIGSNKADADGTSVVPTIEFRPLGGLDGDKRFGHGRLTYDMRDAATDAPTLGITLKTGALADASSTPTESPLAATTSTTRKRFTVGKEAEMVTVRFVQSGPSASTDIYRVELDQRGFPVAKIGSSV